MKIKALYESPHGDGRCVLAVDGSSTRSGVCVLTLAGKLLWGGALIRETGESLYPYQAELKAQLRNLVCLYGIEQVIYEAPFIGYATNAANLYAIATAVEELGVELKIPVVSVANKKWKRGFLGAKLPPDSAAQKQLVRERVRSLDSKYEQSGTDETDAYGIAAYYVSELNKGSAAFESAKRTRGFKYKVALYEGKPAINALAVQDSRPVEEYDLSGKRDFDVQVYSLMGLSDKTLVLRCKRNQFGNMLLRECADKRITDCRDGYTAVVTRARKPRKR